MSVKGTGRRRRSRGANTGYVVVRPTQATRCRDTGYTVLWSVRIHSAVVCQDTQCCGLSLCTTCNACAPASGLSLQAVQS